MQRVKGLIVIWIFVVILVGIGVFIIFSKKETPEKVSRFITESLTSGTPTPFPFQELTIGSLRQREYKSELGELKKYSDNASYTSYLTTYISDGLNVNGLLTIPKTEAPIGGFPAIVFVHGYIPASIYETTERYTDYVNFLARNGFVVFKIDLRGHGDSEGEASGAYYSEDYVIDTLNAYSALQNSDFVNSGKIGLWGHSMAGNVTFRSLVVKKDIPAVVIWAGAVYSYEDMARYGIDDNSYRPPNEGTQRRRKREELRNTYGEFDPSHSFWKQIVPVNFLEGVTGALEIHHAVDDSVVNVGYSRDLMITLDNSKVEYMLFEYSSGGHNLTEGSFLTAMQRTVEFYKKELN